MRRLVCANTRSWRREYIFSYSLSLPSRLTQPTSIWTFVYHSNVKYKLPSLNTNKKETVIKETKNRKKSQNFCQTTWKRSLSETGHVGKFQPVGLDLVLPKNAKIMDSEKHYINQHFYCTYFLLSLVLIFLIINFLLYVCEICDKRRPDPHWDAVSRSIVSLRSEFASIKHDLAYLGRDLQNITTSSTQNLREETESLSN